VYGWMKPTWLDFWEIRIFVPGDGGVSDKKIVLQEPKGSL
jgi:hypothetical protein